MNQKFQELSEFLEDLHGINHISNNDEFFHVRFGICKGIGRLDTQEIRDMGFVIGDIQTTSKGNKYNPTKVLDVWIYPKSSKHLE